MSACEDDEFVMFVVGYFNGSSVPLELPGVTVTALFVIWVNCDDEFIDALTRIVMAKRKALRLSLGNTCMVHAW